MQHDTISKKSKKLSWSDRKPVRAFIALMAACCINIDAASCIKRLLQPIYRTYALNYMVTLVRDVTPLESGITHEQWAAANPPQLVVSKEDKEQAGEIWQDLWIKLKDRNLLPIVQAYLDVQLPIVIFKHSLSMVRNTSNTPRICYLIQNNNPRLFGCIAMRGIDDSTGDSQIVRYEGALDVANKSLTITNKESCTEEMGTLALVNKHSHFPPGNEHMNHLSQSENPFVTNTAYETTFTEPDGSVAYVRIHPSGDALDLTVFDNKAVAALNVALLMVKAPTVGGIGY